MIFKVLQFLFVLYAGLYRVVQDLLHPPYESQELSLQGLLGGVMGEWKRECYRFGFRVQALSV